VVTDFARPGGPTTLLGQGAFQFAIAPTDDLADMLSAAILSDGGQAGLWCIDDATRTARTVGLRCTAQTALQLVGDTPSRQQRVDVLRDAITARADLLDHAFIRTTYQSASSFDDVPMAVPVPRADDAAWYATTTPDPVTVDQARRDFADLLLTDDAIAANPPPWATPGCGGERGRSRTAARRLRSPARVTSDEGSRARRCSPVGALSTGRALRDATRPGGAVLVDGATGPCAACGGGPPPRSGAVDQRFTGHPMTPGRAMASSGRIRKLPPVRSTFSHPPPGFM
jgi:hypothetical protein